MKNRIRSWLLGIILSFPLFAPLTAYAASATLYLSPASGSPKDNVLTVNVRENSGGEPVNSVQANLSYPADSLDLVSPPSSSSAWSVVAENSGGSGSVRIARGALPAVTGDQLVATVRFKAKKDNGTAGITFADGSAVVSANSNTNIMSGSSGGSYTLKPPAPAATTAEPPKDTIPPTITKVSAKEITATTAVITWTTNEPSTSEVTYGPSQKYGIAATDTNTVTDHKVTLSSPLIAPGTKYHFMVKSVDPAGNAASSPDNSFTTVGATLVATVVNQSNKPISGAKVSFGDISGMTDKNGKVTLNPLPLGKQTGTVTYKNKQAPANIQLDTLLDKNGKPHAATFKIDVSSDLWLRILVLLLLIALVGMFFYRKRGNSSSGSGPFGPSASGRIQGKLSAFLAGLKSIPNRLKGLLPKKETKTPGNSDQNTSSRTNVIQPGGIGSATVSPTPAPSTPGVIRPDPPKPST